MGKHLKEEEGTRDTWEKSIPNKVNFLFKGPEVQLCWECLRHSKMASVGRMESQEEE